MLLVPLSPPPGPKCHIHDSVFKSAAYDKDKLCAVCAFKQQYTFNAVECDAQKEKLKCSSTSSLVNKGIYWR